MAALHPAAVSSGSGSQVATSTSGSGGDAPLTWERLRRLVASGSPMALFRRARAAHLAADGLSIHRAPGDDTESERSVAEPDEVLHGLAYPVLRVRTSAEGGQQVLVSCPWMPSREHAASDAAASETAAAHGAAALESQAHAWIDFAELGRHFDVMHVAAAPALDAPSVDGSVGAELDGRQLRLGASAEWPALAGALAPSSVRSLLT